MTPDPMRAVAKPKPKRPLRKWKRALRARLFSLAARGLGHLPPKLATGLLAIPSRVARHATSGKIAGANLEQVFGGAWTQEQLKTCQRGVFQHAARLTAEVTFLSQASSRRRLAWFKRNVEVDSSIQWLHSALAEGRGVILATAHLGNWELIAPAMVDLGLHGAVIGQFRERDPSAHWIVGMRRRAGVTTLPQDSNPKQLLQILKDGGALGLVCDLEVKKVDGVFLPFFERQALTMTAPAALARASRAPIIPVRAVRTVGQPDRYTIQFEPALHWDRTQSKESARDHLLTALNETFERWIRETPQQWAWYQPRWRTRPGDHIPMPIGERKRRTPS